MQLLYFISLKIWKFYLNKQIEKNTALFPLESFPSPKIEKYHELKYEYGLLNANQVSVPLTNLNATPKRKYEILKSNPVSIEPLHNIFSDSDRRDEMPLT
jgi:hypothetical protein